MTALEKFAVWLHDAALGVLIGAALLFLTACGTNQPLTSAPAPTRLEAVATLATNDCQAMTAADYTALITARNAAARRLRAGQLPLIVAQEVQRLGDLARADLDMACPSGRPNAAIIARARKRLHELQVTLEGAK